jgi:hypothetical protein
VNVMSVYLRLRIIVGVLLGGILVIAFASALQLRNLALALGEVGPNQPELAGQLAEHANTAALGLALSGVFMLVVGVAFSRTLRQRVLDRLTSIDMAAGEIIAGERLRRVTLADTVLDQTDRNDAEWRGQNREVRALLVALLHRWPKPAAVTGIDGEIIVSTLSQDAEQLLRSRTPKVRSAATVLLARGFVTASELETEISGPSYHARVQALALGEQRIVGWLAVFEKVSVPPADPPADLGPTEQDEPSDVAQPAGDISQ